MNETAQARRHVEGKGNPMNYLCYGKGEAGHCQLKMAGAAVSQPRMLLQERAVIPAPALQRSLSHKCRAKDWDRPLGLHRLCVAFVLLLPAAGWKFSWLDLTTEIKTNLPRTKMTYRKHLTAESCGRLLLTFT